MTGQNSLTEKAGASAYSPGLEGIVAARTRLSLVDGLNGRLVIAGFPLEEFAGRATFEETVYLLWYGDLPNLEAYTGFREKLAERRGLPPVVMDLISQAVGSQLTTMEALQLATSALRLDKGLGSDEEAGITIFARLPAIVAAYWRMRNGLEPVEPKAGMSFAASYLYMLTGQAPDAEKVRGLDTYLNTVVDHGLNASTFTARVIISTGSDLLSAILGAMGSLKGPLHGGAPGPALDMVFEIGSEEHAERVMRAKLEAGERLMGFGHRVYRVRDPRADVLAAAAERFFQKAGNMDLYRLAKAVEAKAIQLLAEHRPGRNLQTNVEFYTALLLHGLDLPVDLFTPTFTISRTAGWIAHCREQMENNRLYRPQSEYTGETNKTWTELSER